MQFKGLFCGLAASAGSPRAGEYGKGKGKVEDKKKGDRKD